jgi:hypothetical protein
MASHKVPTSDSPPRRALVQPALPVVLIKQSTGRGTFDSSPARPSVLINATAVSNLSLEDLNEPTKTPSNDTNKSGKFYAPQLFRARLQSPMFQRLRHSQTAQLLSFNLRELIFRERRL